MAAKVDIYTWDHCPFCQRALALLQSKNVEFNQHKLDGNEDARMQLAEKTGVKSVPQIFIDEKFIGGCDDIHALDAKGELDPLLN